MQIDGLYLQFTGRITFWYESGFNPRSTPIKYISGDPFLFVKHIDIVKMPQFTLIPKRLISTIFVSTQTKMLERKLEHTRSKVVNCRSY